MCVCVCGVEKFAGMDSHTHSLTKTQSCFVSWHQLFGGAKIPKAATKDTVSVFRWWVIDLIYFFHDRQNSVKASFLWLCLQTACCCWCLKTNRTKRRATRSVSASPWRRSADWRRHSGMRAWLSPWLSCAWTRQLFWASTARRRCWRGTPVCGTALEKVRICAAFQSALAFFLVLLTWNS